jgi:hypothetical protein
MFLTEPMIKKPRCCTVAVQREKRQKQNRPKPHLCWLETVRNVCSVAHTGFEPVISALRGRCPRPLDECASILEYTLLSYSFTTGCVTRYIITLLSLLVNRLSGQSHAFPARRLRAAAAFCRRSRSLSACTARSSAVIFLVLSRLVP